MRERGYAGRTCRDYGHAVVHLGRFLHEERGRGKVRDDEVVTVCLGGHLPGCRCYRRPAGGGEEPVRRGLAHLLVMLREEGNIPPVVADEPRYQELIEGYCRFLRRDRGLAETTVARYRRCLRDLLVSRGDAVSPAELVALSADDLLAFSRQRGAGLGGGGGLDSVWAGGPPGGHREVFLSSRPRHGPLGSKINPWLGRQLDKAGIVTARRGAHVLRHSLAVHLLRSGETLKGIGDLPGHRRPDTTFIYTKPAVEDLPPVALDPAGASGWPTA